ncbi:hypothetical protein QYF36_017862 [Acer negundo]|nr:hypothetical protein QYF36_017862 [Acer negundo]
MVCLKGNPEEAGIGWGGRGGVVLRDASGTVLCLFSHNVGLLDSNSAEILAINIAIELYGSRPDFINRDISIVSDSQTTLSWVNKGDYGNIIHVDIIFDIRKMLKLMPKMEVIHYLRIFNDFADSLAKQV